MKYKKRTVGIAILATYVAHVFWPWISFYSEGDKCTFGTVSNEQYRQYLAEAKDLTKTKWKVPSGNTFDDQWDEEITRRIEEMTKGEQSFYHTIAKTHAVMRAMGGQYFSGSWSTARGINRREKIRRARLPDQSQPMNEISYIVSYRYGFDAIFDRLIPQALFSFGTNANIRVGSDLTSKLTQNLFEGKEKRWTSNRFLYITVYRSTGLKSSKLFSRMKRQNPPISGHCPRLPTRKWLDKYFDYQSRQKIRNTQGVIKP